MFMGSQKRKLEESEGKTLNQRLFSDLKRQLQWQIHKEGGRKIWNIGYLQYKVR